MRQETADRGWQGPAGLALVVLFVALDLWRLPILHVTEVGVGHLLYATLAALGLWVGWKGLRRGGTTNRVGAGLTLVFFLVVVVLLLVLGNLELRGVIGGRDARGPARVAGAGGRNL
jgi:hypothetical protein